jgi:hypothetical protein
MRVICINDTPFNGKAWLPKYDRPFKGRIYTVKRKDVCLMTGRDVFILEEITNAAIHKGGYWAGRFRPVKKVETDISVFTSMLTRITEKA